MALVYALDASALLCLINQDPGQDRVRAALGSTIMSAVNYAEVIAKLVDRGGDVASVGRAPEQLLIAVVDFDRVQAVQAGSSRQATRQAGLSFGEGRAVQAGGGADARHGRANAHGDAMRLR